MNKQLHDQAGLDLDPDDVDFDPDDDDELWPRVTLIRNSQ